MNENMDTGFEDFFGGFEGDDYHVETDEVTAESKTAEETAEAEVADDTAHEGEEESEGGETSEEEKSQAAEKDGAETKAEPEKAEEKRSFDNLKVNGEIRSCTYEEAPAYIQKGMDYDRVKGKLDEALQNNTTLQAELDKNRESVSLLEQAAADSNMSVEQLLDNVLVGLRMGQGESEKEARANIRAMKAERKVKESEQKAAPAKEEPAAEAKEDRAAREVKEFMRDFPGVKLSDEDIKAMRPYVQSGKSMSTAYLMMKNAKLEADAKQREQEAAAKEKNKSNRAKAPASQKDSGGQRTKTAEDDFFSAFEK